MVNNPYIIAALLCQFIILTVALVGIFRSFIGFVLFIVYIGGLIILISYCLMLLPVDKFEVPYFVAILSGIGIIGWINARGAFINRRYAYGILCCYRSVLLAAILLYLVLLSVVEVINYSCGMIKI